MRLTPGRGRYGTGNAGSLHPCLKYGSPFETRGREYLRTFAAVEAGYDSIDERRCVSVAEVLHPKSGILDESASISGRTDEMVGARKEEFEARLQETRRSSDTGSDGYRP